ncbi:gamma-glutamyltransferase, partial [Sphingomonas sp. Root710]|uniref:gamma-glutamyltransferase n=1 Tax=Sphingomonas sp. Root710 TaxID=1736594 RepID=UPI0039E0111A
RNRRTGLAASDDRFGTRTFGEVAEDAIRFARDGFVMYPLMSSIISAFADEYARWSSNAAIYLPKGRPPQPGELFVQSDLANTIQYMVDAEAAAGGDRLDGLQAARDAFYKGDIASRILTFHREHGGLLSAEDLASYRTPVEKPVIAAFDGFELCTPRPWCQGPSMIQALRIADQLDLRSLPHNSVAYIHRLTEALKIAFADRDRYFGDPDHVDVPLDRLLSREHAAQAAARIDLSRATVAEGVSGRETVTLDTSYVCVVDRDGNVFSATPSDVSMDTPVIPGTGIHILCLCRRSRRQRLFRHAQRRLDGHPRHPRNRHMPIVPRFAILGGPRPSLVGGPGEKAAPDAEPCHRSV